METMWPTVFIGLQLVAAIIDDYYTLETSMRWTDVSSACKLAKPNITYKDNGENIQIGALNLEGDTWVGYVVQYVVLNYIGCYQRDYISAVQTFQTRVKVDVCFSACGSSYFAIGGDHLCKCIDKMETLTSASPISWSMCNKSCDNVACGSVNGEYMSVYSRNADSPDRRPTETNPSCFAYDENMSLEYKRCNNNKIDGFICPTIGEENGVCAVVIGELNWFVGIQKCPKHCENKTDNWSTFEGQNGKTFWSSSVGVWVILTNQTQTMVDRPKYVSYVNSSGLLHLTSDLRKNYFALCENTSIYTTQSSTSIASDTTDGVLVVSASSSGHDISTTLSISATPTVMTNTQTTANNNGLYVGLPVGMVLFLTIIVLLVFFRRRIYRLITKAQKNGDTGFNNVIYDDSIEPQTNRDVASTLLSTPPEQPNYYRTVLDPVQTVVTTKQLNKQFTNGADDEAPRDIPQQNNFYDVSDCPSQPIDQHIYDHTDINEGHNNTTTLTENYDSFPPVDDDNTYDVHNSGQRSQNHKDRSDNIYNTPCNLMSDGIIYDHTGGANARGVADENMYGHVSSDVTDNDGEDTYNHI